jgi:hypothetical protein
MSSFKLKNIEAVSDPIFTAADEALAAANAVAPVDAGKNAARTAALDAFKAAFKANVQTLTDAVKANDPKEATEANKAAFLSQFEADQKVYVNTFKSEGTSTYKQVATDLLSKLLGALRCLLLPALISESYRTNSVNMMFTGGAHTDVSAEKQTATNALNDVFEAATVAPGAGA